MSDHLEDIHERTASMNTRTMSLSAEPTPALFPHVTTPTSTTLYVPIASPPTPAPSPRLSMSIIPPQPSPVDPATRSLVHPSLHDFASLPSRPASASSNPRLAYLTSLLSICTPAELLFISQTITPLLKRDFLTELPVELALHVLGFIDDTQTLVRVQAVSRGWKALAEDEGIWKRMCEVHGFDWSEVAMEASHLFTSGSKGKGRASRSYRPREDLDEPLVEMERFADYPMDPALQWLIDKNRRKHQSSTSSLMPCTHHSTSTNEDGFSYRKYFKYASKTMFNWRRGGELLRAHRVPIAPSTSAIPVNINTHPTHPHNPVGALNASVQSPPTQNQPNPQQDSSVITSLALDAEFVVVGLANTRIHIFSTKTGVLSRTLVGHELGVWGVCLVSRGGKVHREHISNHKPPEAGRQKDKKARTSRRKQNRDKATDDADFNGGPIKGIDDVSTPLASKSGATSGQIAQHVEESATPSASSSRPDDQHTRTHRLRRRRSEDNVRSQAGPSSSCGSRRPRPPVSPPSTDSRLAAARPRDDLVLPSLRTALGLDLDYGYGAGAGVEGPRAVDGIQRKVQQAHSDKPSGCKDGESSGDDDDDDVLSELDLDDKGYLLDSDQPCKRNDECCATEGWGQPNALVVSGGCDKVLRVWDVKSGYCIYVLQGHTSTVRCIKVLHNRPIAVTGSRDSTLRVWDIQRGQMLRVLEGHTQSVRCLDVFGNKVVSGSYDTTLRLWNVDTGECLHVMRGHFNQIYSVAYDGVRIASGGLDTTVRVWDAKSGHCIALLAGHSALVCQLQLGHNTLATGGSDGRVITFSLSTYTVVQRIAAHDSSVTSLQFDTRFLVTGGNDGRVRLFETRTGNYVRELTEPCDSVWKVAYRQDTCAIMCRRAGKTVMEIWSFKPKDKD